MANNPYVVRMAHEEDAIFCHKSEKMEVRDFLNPVDRELRNEITCMMFPESAEDMNIGYHQHGSGLEVFIPTSGKIEICSQGQLTYMEPGDLFVIRPFMSHSFKAKEPNSHFMCLFRDFNMIQSIEKRSYIVKNFPGLYGGNKEFTDYFDRDTKGKMDRLVPDPVPTDREKVFALRRQGVGLFDFSFPGINLHLKVGRWENAGFSEFWEADMKKGVTVEWGELRKEWRLFYVFKGSVAFDVNGEKFTVDEPALVNIPPFRPFSFQTNEDTVMFDLDCPAMLHAFLEEIGDPAKKRWPTDPAELKALKDKFNLHCTKFEYAE